MHHATGNTDLRIEAIVEFHETMQLSHVGQACTPYKCIDQTSACSLCLSLSLCLSPLPRSLCSCEILVLLWPSLRGFASGYTVDVVVPTSDPSSGHLHPVRHLYRLPNQVSPLHHSRRAHYTHTQPSAARSVPEAGAQDNLVSFCLSFDVLHT